MATCVDDESHISVQPAEVVSLVTLHPQIDLGVVEGREQCSLPDG